MHDDAESLDGEESLPDESLADAQDDPGWPMESLDTPEADPGPESLLDAGVDDGESLDDGTADHGSDDFCVVKIHERTHNDAGKEKLGA